MERRETRSSVAAGAWSYAQGPGVTRRGRQLQRGTGKRQWPDRWRRPRPSRSVRQQAMSTRKITEGPRRGFAKRLLVCFLAALFALQPLVRASSPCSAGSSASDGGRCCCSAPESVLVPSCCSTGASNPETSGAPILAARGGCGCELQAPVPVSALPLESSIRGAERDGHSGFERWIEAGALVSASTPVQGWDSPPGIASDARCGEMHPFPDRTAAISARRPRGLLDLICVARC